MKNRCANAKDKNYALYGGKGITVCDEWRTDPVAFVEWCEAEPKAHGKTLLDRKDSNEGYSPSNCRFVTDAQSVRNRSMSVWATINGERLVLKDAIQKYGKVSYGCAKLRVRVRGWTPEAAVLTPYVRGIVT